LVLELTPETAVPILDLKRTLSIFKNLECSPNSWTGFVRGSISKWRPADGEAVLKAVQEAVANPVSRPFDKARLRYRPKKLDSKIGSVVVPEPEPVDMPQPSQFRTASDV
jgi:hypothetical protein